MFGSQGPWYYQAIAGINRAVNSTGWEKLTIYPRITERRDNHVPRQLKVFIPLFLWFSVTNISGIDATIGTHRGPIRSAWNSMVKDTESVPLTAVPVFWHSVGIPVGVLAEVHVSTFQWSVQSVTIQESGRTVWSNGKFQPGQAGITKGTAGKGEVIFDVGSGVYEFQVMVPRF